MNPTTWPSRRAIRIRRRVRATSAALACFAAGTYTAIGLGYLVVLGNSTAPTTLQQAAFGFPAALLYGGIAIMSIVADSRVTWFVAAVVQAVSLVAYADLAMVRTPAFEPIGLMLAGLQLVLLVLFGWLSLRRTQTAYRSRSPLNRTTVGGSSRLLVAHDGSDHAKYIAGVLVEHCTTVGVVADCREATEIQDATAYDGVVVVGRVRRGSWSWKLQRFHHVHYHALVARHVWLVTVATHRTGSPTASEPRAVRRLRKAIGIHSHTVITDQTKPEDLHQFAVGVARTMAGSLYMNATRPADQSPATTQFPQR